MNTPLKTTSAIFFLIFLTHSSKGISGGIILRDLQMGGGKSCGIVGDSIRFEKGKSKNNLIAIFSQICMNPDLSGGIINYEMNCETLSGYNTGIYNFDSSQNPSSTGSNRIPISSSYSPILVEHTNTVCGIGRIK